MRRVLLVDVETSGVDPAKDQIIELGLVAWSVAHRSTIASASWLVKAPSNAAEAINKIPAPLLADEGVELGRVLELFRRWAEPVDLIMAHNADFDSAWLPDVSRPWCCSAYDVQWPRSCGDRTLTSLALAHGIAVLDAHRALPDCQMIARLLERVAELGHDIEALLARAMRPKVKVISLAPFEEKEIVKAAGFRWSPERKVWWRMMPAEDLADLPFAATTVVP